MSKKRGATTFWHDEESLAEKHWNLLKGWCKRLGIGLNMPKYPEKKRTITASELIPTCMTKMIPIVNILNKNGFSTEASFEKCIYPLFETCEKILKEYDTRGELKNKNLGEIHDIIEQTTKQYFSNFLAN